MSFLSFIQRFRCLCSVIILLFVSILTLTLSAFGFFDGFDHDLFDRYTRQFRHNAIPDPRVALVMIDDHSVAQFGEVFGRWPWPREVYADLLAFLNLGGAKAIYFDLLFVEDELDQDSQQRFIAGLAEAGNAYVGMVLTQENQAQFIRQLLPDDIMTRFSLSISGNSALSLPDYNNFLLPLPAIRDPLAGLPVYTFASDRDGVYRRAPVLFRYGESWFASLGLSALMAETGTSQLSVDDNAVQVGTYTIPISRTGTMLLNWYPKGFSPYSVSGLFASYAAIQEGEVADLIVSPEEFRDKIVIVGASAVGLHDLKATPISSALPGPELHATFISNVLSDETLRAAPNVLHSLVIFLLAALSAYFVVFGRRLSTFLIALFLTASLVGLSVALFVRWHVFFGIGASLFALLTSYFIALVYVNVIETMERLKIKASFSKYVAPAVMQEILANHDDLRPEIGRKLEASILFTDIRSFTSISEHFSVEKVVALLNRYFDGMIDVIYRHEGTVDKMIGDAIMAFWNAPITVPDHEKKAVLAAVEMQNTLRQLNQDWASDGYPPIEMGVGINTGNVIIGNIGSERRLDFTAIGDHVNLASRMEGLCKVYGSDIIVSDRTYMSIKNDMLCRHLDKVRVKGKTDPTTIHAPMSPTFEEEVGIWNRFFQAYLLQDWQGAENWLKLYMDRQPTDVTAGLYRRRLDVFKVTSPGKDWDGVAVMTEK